MKRLMAAAICLVLSAATWAQQGPQPAERHFRFHYDFTVRNTDPGNRLRLWLPLAHSDAYQSVRVLSTTTDVPLKKTREAEYGNEMLYGEVAKAEKAEYKFSVVYEVVRKERIKLRDGQFVETTKAKVPEIKLARYLQPDRLVPTSGLPAQLAAQETQGHTGELDRAKAIYEYVMRTMKYDKSGTGWGRGDVAWACDAKRGNCTDFHSLFIAMARSQGIPSRFEIGFPLPATKQAGDIAGYHCWAEFYVKGQGWVPIDISEGWKDPSRREYFFGAHDANRVQFTMGRDIRLSPAQDGALLNYFVYPYVELGGREYNNVATSFWFDDQGGATAQTAGR